MRQRLGGNRGFLASGQMAFPRSLQPASRNHLPLNGSKCRLRAVLPLPRRQNDSAGILGETWGAFDEIEQPGQALRPVMVGFELLPGQGPPPGLPDVAFSPHALGCVTAKAAIMAAVKIAILKMS